MFNKILKPMLLKEVDKPFNNKDYIYELKYDGIRALIYVSSEFFKIITRNGNDVAKIYPELKSIQKLVGKKSVIFDGEIVAFKGNKPSFSELAKRNHLKNAYKINKIKNEIPVYFIAFDIIYLDKDLTDLELVERKEILNRFNDTEVFMKTKMYDDGIELFKHIKKIGLEGIVAKQKTSKYILGKRVDSWIKIKNFKKEYFYVHGFIKLKDKYSLFLGEYKNKKFTFVGKVSVTSDNPILEKLKDLKRINNKFINFNEKGIYIEPKYKILVHYMEKTDSNILRQPFIKKEQA